MEARVITLACQRHEYPCFVGVQVENDGGWSIVDLPLKLLFAQSVHGTSFRNHGEFLAISRRRAHYSQRQGIAAAAEATLRLAALSAGEAGSAGSHPIRPCVVVARAGGLVAVLGKKIL